MNGGIDHDLGDAPYYGCQGCHREIKFSTVLQMGAVLHDDSGHGPTFWLEWACVCRPDPLDNYFIVEKSAIRRLLSGLRPVVPYSAAERLPLPLREEQEAKLRVFRWECQQLESVEEFLLFASRPEAPKSPE